MNFIQAVSKYRKNPDSENLERLTRELCGEMNLREKTRMLHGSYLTFFSRVIFGKLFHGSIFYLPFKGGGCRRLGIPQYRFSDGPRGAVTGHGTCFPSAMMRGAAFDTELEYRIGKAIAAEVSAAGANYFAGICINLVRNPKWGRSQESYSEDPHLLGAMGSALVKAVQEEGITACPKHYALNSIENLRFLESSNTDERTLREIYLHHFKKCIDAGALSLMGAYNKVNGTYCCENSWLLKDILRDEWGFDGFTMSDFIWGVHDTAAALKAGMDCEMPGNNFYSYRKIRKSINKGEMSLEDVDKSVRNIITVMIRMTPNLRKQSRKIMKCSAHLDLAEETAVKGMVLIKNIADLLPLSREEEISVVGPYADTINIGDKGSSMVVVGREGITPYAGLCIKFPNVNVYNGINPRRALSVSEKSETVIACIGCSKKDEGEFLNNPGKNIEKRSARLPVGDRNRLDLNPDHLALLKALKNAGKKVIAVLYTGSVILTGNLEQYCDALILAFYGGARFGSALASLLTGEKNFSGKLPLSIAEKESDYPPFLEIGQKPYEIEYGYYNGYYLFDKTGITPSYPFGFGLSYTNFSMENFRAFSSDDGGITAEVMVKNMGDKTGTETVQVYTGSAGGNGDRPVKMLRGFKKVELGPGEEKSVEINIPSEDLEFYDPAAKQWAADPVYRVYAGNSSRNAEENCVIINYI